MKRLVTLLLVLFILLSQNLYSQVGINTDGSSPTGSSILDIKSTTAGLLIPRMTLSERNSISNPATGLMIYQTDNAAGFYYYNGSIWVGIVSNTHYVGELYGGGVVFWVDHTGQHGLIASMIDIGTVHAWSNVSSTLIGITAQSDWDGLSNSNAIVGQPGHTNSAAKVCFDYVNADYGTGIYSDWYLPAIGELNHLWNNIYEVQKTLDSDSNPATKAITKSLYWSSSESNYLVFNAWLFYFSNGYSVYYNKSNSYYVRAVRSF